MAYIQDWGMRVQAQSQINTTRRAFLHLSQNENGRMLNIRITDVNIPAGSTAVLAGTKPDGTVYSQAGTLAGNTATFAEDVQMTAVAGTWDAKITITNGGNCICTARITITIDPDTVAGGAIPSDSQLDGIIAECRAIADSVRKEAYGSPLVADAVEDMTDQSRVYVYTGSESGMTAGHWYYYNGTAWTDGGVYNAIAVDTDTTLTIAGKAADAKKVGDELADLKEDLQEYEGIFTGNVDESVQNWLDDHPEATTTVQDGAITAQKLAEKSVTMSKLADDVTGLFENTGFYDEVTVETGTYVNENGNDTTYYVATVPKNDAEENQIDIYVGYDTDVSPLGYAGKNLTTLTTNTSLDLVAGKPAVISNGQVVRESTFDEIASSYPFAVYVGFDSDRVPHEYPITTAPTAMINDGIVNAAAAYYRLVTNGTAVDVSDIGLPASNLKAHPRMAMFIKYNGDVCFIACDGRDSIDEGLTPSELAELMIELGAVDGWNMDGGGSVSMVVDCNKINRNVDGNGTEDRAIHVTWNVARKFANPATQEAIAQIGIEKQRLIKQILTYIGISTTEEETDPTTLDAGDYYIIHAVNVPSEASPNGFAKVLRKRNSKVARVYWQPYSSGAVFLKWTNGVEPVTWSDWIKLDANELWDIGVAIPTGSDFNNYTSVGKYRVISASIANNITNIPTKSPGTLFVFKSNNDNVLYQVYYTGYAKVYTRRINLGASPVEYGVWAIFSEIRTKTVSATSDINGVISLESSFNNSEVLSMHTSGYIILPYKDGTAWNGKLLTTSLQPVAATVSVVVTHTLNTYINDVTS